MTFLTNHTQRHFILYEIQLPYCTVCTPVEGLTQSFHTPVTCQESSDSTYSLWLCDGKKTPVGVNPPTPAITGKNVLNSTVFRLVTSASETTAKLKAGEGVASRGTMTLTCADAQGDPGPITFTDSGTFFGKLMARNILQNRKIISHKYSIVDGTATEVESSTHFIENVQLTKGVFTLKAKDALKDIEAWGEKFPAVSDVTLTADIDASTTTIPVTDASGFAINDVFRIEEELFYITNIVSNDLTVAARGTSLVNGSNVIYRTNVSSHDSGSTVQKCYTMNNRLLSDVFSDIFDAIGLTAYKDYTQWNDEISQWTSQAYQFGVMSEPMEASKILDNLCSSYIIDMWLDQPSQKVKISATTAWKESIRILAEGNDIQDLKISQEDALRVSRCFLYNGKDYQAESDEPIYYKRITSASDLASETTDFYGSPKEKDLGFSPWITGGSAQTTVSRYVQRFSKSPKTITFSIEERKLGSTGLSDVVDIVSRDTQTPSGEYLQSRDRAQIVRIQPDLKSIGRKYNVTALSYVPLIESGGGPLVITLSGSLLDVNLYSRAGAPAAAVDVTFVFDGCTIGSSDGTPSVRAGAWPGGSTIKIICINNTKWSAKGGNGGIAYAARPRNAVNSIAGNGTNGNNSYQSDGVPTDIYLNYGTVDGYPTSAELYAAGGGGGGTYASATFAVSNVVEYYAASGGGAGSGIPGGNGGTATFEPGGESPAGVNGQDGNFNTIGVATNVRAGPDLYVEARGADGGFSVNSPANNSHVFGAPTDQSFAYGASGIAGGAIKGSNVVVYNLAASASKLRQGNSDAFTLVTV